ncbi:2-amino-4-hydroxy-6-hydroxymethyldihydropteridine diphosphokinase [Aneurinibacillus thermoaerophilus]|uniref:2-amino-4-hydroxy-6- hydroxymethyldihydropteridine diphosphokinase n=1 Tax=Aneurinibacillus thermoaerophilus TaxID=143495 RepID=UPI002E1C7FAD|nr:2-amino-4-hydroxy-6-hydroxymethyldihydropteridine diphosphokinase [Aneurinibacillus thermoaerophilus]
MSRQSTQVFLGLGSNIGDREKLLICAIRMLDAVPGIKVTCVSSLYETDPVGYTEQDTFLNLVVEIETILSPAVLLANTQQIEAELGRVRTIRWGPRTLDIDILLYGKQWIRDKGLEIPHPRMLERAFVIVPLAEIAPEIEIPYKQDECIRFFQVKEVEPYTQGREGVRKLKRLGWKKI